MDRLFGQPCGLWFQGIYTPLEPETTWPESVRSEVEILSSQRQTVWLLC